GRGRRVADLRWGHVDDVSHKTRIREGVGIIQRQGTLAGSSVNGQMALDAVHVAASGLTARYLTSRYIGPPGSRDPVQRPGRIVGIDSDRVVAGAGVDEGGTADRLNRHFVVAAVAIESGGAGMRGK